MKVGKINSATSIINPQPIKQLKENIRQSLEKTSPQNPYPVNTQEITGEYKIVNNEGLTLYQNIQKLNTSSNKAQSNISTQA
ncbi:MAG: hypothetical protein DRN08_07525 [Thermoplasmata archaeon]|nr:MAG: hypothetical protein DRN08_07525 [Thermoplasmata archaeon]